METDTSGAADGWIRLVSLSPPSLQDNTADADRLKNQLKRQLNTESVEIDLSVLRELPFRLRDWGYSARCVVVKKRDADLWYLTGISNPLENQRIVGVAVDLGTSRVVIRLVELSKGEILFEAPFDNPQLSVGPDVLTRIHACDQPDGLEKLNRMIVDELNQRIQNACNACGLDTSDVYLMALAGNTSMTHIFMGLSPKWLIREPYIPVINSPDVQTADAYGLQINSAGRVFILPNIGSYFLGNDSWLVACAGAAGPALEGGVAQIGMMAGPGVIDRLPIDPGTRVFQIHTIDDLLPIGICGSGMIDLAANLFLAGMIDLRGRFVSKVCGKKLVMQSGIPYLEIVSADESGTGQPLMISQADMDSLIRSKAAMYTILETITESVGMALADLKTFHVAGTFGAFIDPVSAVTIGMLPDLPPETFQTLGNSSLEGATQVLTSCESMTAIERIKEKITYLELNVNQTFMNRFSAAKFLPHTDRSRFPSVKI
ncbi:MAG: DUF4445 domain-containing protein [Deltaproteobacteria bacterium]|nr:DUF4445 domain-containing protein [Deltaproteobacteria bacterium]